MTWFSSRGVAAAGCLLLALAAGCRAETDPAPEIQLAWRLLPHPPRMGPARLAFTLTDRTTEQPVTGARVRVEANMTHPGMRPVPAEATEVRPGHYEADLTLTMSGDWFVLLEITLPDDRVLNRQFDVPGVQARP